jgi:hypothetical protein
VYIKVDAPTPVARMMTASAANPRAVLNVRDA